jgi:pimeloyl-ACP methyl ester carboxylesterase
MPRWSRLLRWSAFTLVALVTVSLAATWLRQRLRHADAAPAALALAHSDDEVSVEQGRFLTLRPRRHPDQPLGVIFYPGAYVDVRGYLPTLRPLAAAGYRVVIVPMPFELAIFGIDRALDVRRANPDIAAWVIIGHSVGGAMAALCAGRHPDAFAGLIIWDSYPPALADLGRDPRPVWLIHRATPDGAAPASFARQRHLFPPHARWAPIRGGIHMHFGAFTGGGYVEDWPAGISQAAQHREVVRLTLQALAQMARGVLPQSLGPQAGTPWSPVWQRAQTASRNSRVTAAMRAAAKSSAVPGRSGISATRPRATSCAVAARSTARRVASRGARPRRMRRARRVCRPRPRPRCGG